MNPKWTSEIEQWGPNPQKMDLWRMNHWIHVSILMYFMELHNYHMYDSLWRNYSASHFIIRKLCQHLFGKLHQKPFPKKDWYLRCISHHKYYSYLVFCWLLNRQFNKQWNSKHYTVVLLWKWSQNTSSPFYMKIIYQMGVKNTKRSQKHNKFNKGGGVEYLPKKCIKSVMCPFDLLDRHVH